MCLEIEWFAGSEERKLERKNNGVSLEEAEANLRMFHTTIYPVAQEMAEWLYSNWTLEQLIKLDTMSLALLVNYIGEKVDKDLNSNLKKLNMNLDLLNNR